jgi:hypothetical protein
LPPELELLDDDELEELCPPELELLDAAPPEELELLDEDELEELSPPELELLDAAPLEDELVEVTPPDEVEELLLAAELEELPPDDELSPPEPPPPPPQPINKRETIAIVSNLQFIFSSLVAGFEISAGLSGSANKKTGASGLFSMACLISRTHPGIRPNRNYSFIFTGLTKTIKWLPNVPRTNVSKTAPPRRNVLWTLRYASSSQILQDVIQNGFTDCMSGPARRICTLRFIRATN